MRGQRKDALALFLAQRELKAELKTVLRSAWFEDSRSQSPLGMLIARMTVRPMTSSMLARGPAPSAARHNVTGSVAEVKVGKRQGRGGFKVVVVRLADGDARDGG